MRKHGAISNVSNGFCIFIVMTVLTIPVFAQNQEAPQPLYTISYMQVKPGMALEFEQFIKSSLPALKQMGIPWLETFKTANFGVSDKYMFLTPLQDAADMDAELSASQSNVPVGIISMMSAIQRMVVQSNTFMLIPQTDVNIPPQEGYEWKLIANVTIGVAPGKDLEFRNGIKRVMTAIDKTDVKGVLLGRVGLGGNLDQYILTVLYDSFADMMQNQPAVQRELAATDLTTMNGVVYYRESEIMTRVPELCLQEVE